MRLVDGVIDGVMSEEHVFSRPVRSLVAPRSIVWAAVQAREGFENDEILEMASHLVSFHIMWEFAIVVLERINAYSSL